MEQGAKGNFRINFNTKKQAGDSQPVLERGIISTPDAPEETFEVKMWAYADAAGRVFYAGPSSEVRRDAVGLDRAEALTLAEVRAVDVAEVEKSAETAEGITLSPHRVMLFRNGYKIAKNDPRHGALSDADKAVNDKRPDLYGFWNPGADATGKPRAQLKVSVWQHEGRYGPFLAGNTQEAQPGKVPTTASIESVEPEITSSKTLPNKQSRARSGGISGR